MTTDAPCVSVGLPVYNGERYLSAALDSLLAQTFTDFELIISDNASTDRTAEICRAYAARDARIRYYRTEQNQGGSWNFRRVFELATGKYFRWAAHDDTVAPQFLERCVAELDQHPEAVLCFPRTVMIDEYDRQIEEYDDQLDLGSPKPHVRYQQYHDRFYRDRKCNILFGLMRRHVLGQTRLIQSYVSSDVILLGELALRGQFIEIQEPLFFRRDHPETSIRAYTSYADRLAWFDPAKRGSVLFPRWRWFAEYMGSVARVPMKLHEKVACYLEVGRWALRFRRPLAKELGKAIVVKTPLWSMYQAHKARP